MRVKNSIKNIYISIFTQLIITLLGFISRRVFISSLGSEYLGVNGLLTNVLSMLSLVEGGIGTSIVYNLYKPLAEDDKPRVVALIQLYKKTYAILAIIVFVLSMALYPFLGVLVKQSEGISYLPIVYFLFVFKNIVSYLNAHKWSLINADQKGYVLARYNLLFNVITTIAKIVVLATTQNYVLYLVIEVLIFLVQNIWNGKVVNERYPYIKVKEKFEVDKDTKETMKENVKAMFLHNVGGYCVFGTDNILISALVNLKTVGLYSNYTMVINQLKGLLIPIIDGIGASVGNLIATESKEKSYEIFNIVYLINFWIYGFCSIILFNLLEPFIDFWLGKGLLLDKFTFVIILLNFYISGLRSSIITFKTKGGIFRNDKYVPIIESVINLVASIILAKNYGLVGIFLGTTVSTLAIPFWLQPKLVYNNVFNRPVLEYFTKYFKYLFITLFAGAITTMLCNHINISHIFMELVIKGILGTISVNVIFLVVFFRTKEMKYIFTLLKGILNGIYLKLKRA